MRSYSIYLLGALVSVLLLSIPLFCLWQWRQEESLERRAYRQTLRMLEQEDFAQAIPVIREFRAKYPKDSPEGAKWLEAEVTAAEATSSVSRLTWLFARNSKELLQHEKASRLVARAAIETHDFDKAQEVMAHWKQKEDNVDPEWFIMEADTLIRQEKPEEAIAFLESREFAGAADCDRLTRLALLRYGTAPEKAWAHLDEAVRKDPRNSDVRVFRAQILEAAGKLANARVEYVAAFVANSQKPLYRDRLAEFYRRYGKYRLAIQTWKTSGTEPTLDLIVLKRLFWQRVAVPEPAAPVKIPAGKLAPLANFVHDIPAEQFWDEAKYRRLDGAARFTAARQEVFWLKLLQLLKDGRDQDAVKWMEKHSQQLHTWHPELEVRIAEVLNYRNNGRLCVATSALLDKLPENQHQLFVQLASESQRALNGQPSEVSDELHALLKSRHAFSALMLAGGWTEAALQLLPDEKIPAEIPDWFAYGITQALKMNRGASVALAFATGQRESDELELLTAELLISVHKTEDAIERLKPLIVKSGGVGVRSSWLLSELYLASGKTEQARSTILGNLEFSQRTAGKELLARSYLLTGDVEQAEKLLEPLGDDSMDSMSLRARQAFERKDWDEARRLTRLMMSRAPDEMQVRQNLVKIDQAEQDSETP